MVTRFIDALDASNAVIATHTETNDAIMSWNIPTIFPTLTEGVTYNFVMRTPETLGYTVPEVFSPLDLGAKLLFWFDASDKSVLWQDAAGTNPVTTSGQTIARMLDKSGNGYVLNRRASGTTVYTESGGNAFLAQNGDAAGYSTTTAVTGLTSTCEYYALLRTSDTGDSILGAVATAAPETLFGRVAGFAATAVNMTTPTYYKNGASVGVITAGNAMRAQFVTGSWVQLGAAPLDMTGASWTGVFPFNNPNWGPATMNGDWMHSILTTQLTELERFNLMLWLQGRVNPL